MLEDFDVSQEETGFPLLKLENFASFTLVNKLVRLAYLRGACHLPGMTSSYHRYQKWEKSVYYIWNMDIWTIFNMSDWIRLKVESHIHLGCFEGECKTGKFSFLGELTLSSGVISVLSRGEITWLSRTLGMGGSILKYRYFQYRCCIERIGPRIKYWF